MSDIIIKTIPPYHNGRLHVLFKRALQSDFAYFSQEYRGAVAKQHSRLKLTIGSVHPQRLFLGVYHSRELVGYSISSYRGDSSFLYWLFVTPRLRKQQLGRRLLNTTEQHLTRRGVDTIHLVTHNQEPFYQVHGYTTHKKFVDDISGVAMSSMQKALV